MNIVSILYKLETCIISIGIIGNLISFLIFTRPCLNSKTNTGKLYALLCVINLITIIYEMLSKDKDYSRFRIHLPLYIEYFIQLILLQILSWIQVLITFDRFIYVVFPVKGSQIMRKKLVLFSIIFGMFILIFGINTPSFIPIEMNISVFTAMETVKISMQFVIPYLLMVILDVIVIVRLRKRRTGLGQRESTNRNKSHRFARNTILIDLVYLVFNFSPTIFKIYNLFLLLTSQRPLLIPLAMNFFTYLFSSFPYIYSSLLFVLFFISNGIFRSEFILILHKCFNFIKNRLF